MVKGICRSQAQRAEEEKEHRAGSERPSWNAPRHPPSPSPSRACLSLSPGRPTRSRTDRATSRHFALHSRSRTPGRPLRADTQGPPGKRAPNGGRIVAATAAAGDEVTGYRGAVRAVRVERERRAPQLPRLPRVAVRGPLLLPARGGRGLLGGLPPPGRRRARGRPRPPPPRRRRPRQQRHSAAAAAALRRAGPGVADRGRVARLRLPPRSAPPRGRAPPPALPRQPPPRLRGRAGRVRHAARALLPRPRLLRAPLRARRGRLQGLLVLLPRRRRVRRQRLALVVGRRGLLRRRGRLLGVPRRALLHGLRALPGHLLPADPKDGRLRARVRQVHRRRHRAAAPPPDQGAAQEDQPPVPQVHCLQPRARLRQPVRRAARHHQAARRRQSRHRRRARAVLDESCGGSAGVPVQRGEDHAQDAGDDERGGGVARGRHGARLRQRPGEPGPGPAAHRGLPGARQRLPRGRRRRVRQRRRQPERVLLPRRPKVRAVPGQQHQLPEEAGAGDVPGEQPGGDHGVRLRGGPGVAARALHDRVLARHVAARQDRRHLLNPSHPSILFCRQAPVTQVQSFHWRNYVQNECG